MKQKYFLQGIALLLLAQIMVGVNIVISKSLLTTIPVLILLAIRFILATIILLPLHWLTPARQLSIKEYFLKLHTRDWLFIVGQALCAGILFNCLMLTGLHYTDANVAGIITSALPAIIAVMSWAILREKISAQKSFCVFFATIGLIIIGYDKLQELDVTNSFLGDSFVLLSLFPEAAYYVLCKLHTNYLPPFLISALLNGINAILLLPVFLFIPWDPFSIQASSWFVLILVGLSTGLFYVFWFIGAQRVDGVMMSLSTAMMPVSTVILAWIFLGEKLTPLQTAGMSLVILSIFLYAKR
jgi:drug/metabolite transporter (DMT)-like permease